MSATKKEAGSAASKLIPPVPPANLLSRSLVSLPAHRAFSPEKTPAGMSGAYASPSTGGGRLSHVAERFSQFYNDLEIEKNNKRMAEEEKRHNLVEQVAKLERGMEAEIKRRMEADKALQVTVEAEMKAMQEAHHQQMRDIQMSMNASVDALSRTLADLHRELQEEKEHRRMDSERLLATLLGKVDEAQGAVEEERAVRIDRETQNLKRVGEDIFRVQEKVDVERCTREGALTAMQAELREAISSRLHNDDKFQAVVLGEISSLKTAVQLEREERVSEDEQIVFAINDYTQAMQDGLRLAVRS